MKLSGAVFCLILLAACSQSSEDPYADWSAKEIYDSARSAMNAAS